MNKVAGISSQPKQQLSFVVEDGSQVALYLEYRPQQLGWFANLSWRDWELNGLRVVSSPNILRQWQNVIPFGLAIITAKDADPLNVTDFADATSTMIFLSAGDVLLVDETAFVGL